jgi:hypothetical protein
MGYSHHTGWSSGGFSFFQSAFTALKQNHSLALQLKEAARLSVSFLYPQPVTVIFEWREQHYLSFGRLSVQLMITAVVL